jgi:hypothetical protein
VEAKPADDWEIVGVGPIGFPAVWRERYRTLSHWRAMSVPVIPWYGPGAAK